MKNDYVCIVFKKLISLQYCRYTNVKIICRREMPNAVFSSDGRICRANKSHHRGRIEQRKQERRMKPGRRMRPGRRMKSGRRIKLGRRMRRIWLERRTARGDRLPNGTSIPRPVLSNLCRKKNNNDNK